MKICLYIAKVPFLFFDSSAWLFDIRDRYTRIHNRLFRNFWCKKRKGKDRVKKEEGIVVSCDKLRYQRWVRKGLCKLFWYVNLLLYQSFKFEKFVAVVCWDYLLRYFIFRFFSAFLIVSLLLENFFGFSFAQLSNFYFFRLFFNGYLFWAFV